MIKESNFFKQISPNSHNKKNDLDPEIKIGMATDFFKKLFENLKDWVFLYSFINNNTTF